MELQLITNGLIKSYQKSFTQLKNEISLFKENEDSLWDLTDGVTNTSGNLCLHLCGNLKHFIGAILGHSGYERNRPEEFSAIGFSVDELLAKINDTEEMVLSTIKKLTEADLNAIYPKEIGGNSYTAYEFLLHLHAHMHYHLGQINYLRRILN
ncbi:MAG TPA: DinB family protein [Fulvivirga sp.]|nr:DinB family protein [Fulvivirga sp.]